MSRLSKKQKYINIAKPNGRFEDMHVDITGPLPVSGGCSYILTEIDCFSLADDQNHILSRI